MDSTSDVDLLLIGKTGDGKSALGNSILKRKVFKSMATTDSVTTTVTYEVSEYKGKIIKVVDGPGVKDTRLESKVANNLMVKQMEKAIGMNPRGYHAFLLVVKFGGRFTAEDKDMVAFLKSLFGENFVRDFVIMVMTHGDNFENEAEQSGKTFEKWCSEQVGAFQELFNECNRRVLLFDNTVKDEDKRNAQIDRLLAMVQKLQAQSRRYTDENFERAQSAREKIMVELERPAIQDAVFQETSLILQKLDEMTKVQEVRERIEQLRELLFRCDELIKRVKEEGKGTQVLQNIERHISAVRKSVDENIHCQEINAVEEVERLQNEIQGKTKELNNAYNQVKKAEEAGFLERFCLLTEGIVLLPFLSWFEAGRAKLDSNFEAAVTGKKRLQFPL